MCRIATSHPFEKNRWTMDSYYGFSAFFSRGRRIRKILRNHPSYVAWRGLASCRRRGQVTSSSSAAIPTLSGKDRRHRVARARIEGHP